MAEGGTVGRLQLRRHLYEELGHARRGRRALRRQIRVLEAAAPFDGDGGGAAGVREPRRPRPSSGPVPVRRVV